MAMSPIQNPWVQQQPMSFPGIEHGGMTGQGFKSPVVQQQPQGNGGGGGLAGILGKLISGLYPPAAPFINFGLGILSGDPNQMVDSVIAMSGMGQQVAQTPTGKVKPGATDQPSETIASTQDLSRGGSSGDGGSGEGKAGSPPVQQNLQDTAYQDLQNPNIQPKDILNGFSQILAMLQGQQQQPMEPQDMRFQTPNYYGTPPMPGGLG